MIDGGHPSNKGKGYGRYQGAHWRRSCRFAVGFFVLVTVGLSWIRHTPTLQHVLTAVVIVAGIFVICEWWFGRRPGVGIEPDGLRIRGSIRSVHIPWSQVQGYKWKEVPSLTSAEHLYVETAQTVPRRVPKDAPIRLPTIARMNNPSSWPNDRYLGPLLTSPNIRSTTGKEVDADSTFEQALRVARNRGESPSSPSTAAHA